MQLAKNVVVSPVTVYKCVYSMYGKKCHVIMATNITGGCQRHTNTAGRQCKSCYTTDLVS